MMANLKEGARRIKIVGQLALFICAILFASFFLPFARLAFFHNILMGPTNPLRTAITAAALLWALGWILEGFASSDQSSR